jgi:ribosomal protein L16 Arg81 hydroxylase
MQYGLEKSPFQATTLVPGDVLYIPAGMWHMARAIERSLSVSVGVFAPTGIDLLETARAQLLQDPLWRQRMPLEVAARRDHLEKLRNGLIARINDAELLEDPYERSDLRAP